MTVGRELIEKEIKRLGLSPGEVMTDEALMQVAQKFNFQDSEDMYSAVGFGGITAAQICTRLTEKQRKELEAAQKLKDMKQELKEAKTSATKRKTRPVHGVSVKGIDNLLIRFARCCNPVPGDEIIGFITRGRGVSVHRFDCRNLPFDDDREAHRLIEVEWDSETSSQYSVEIEITGHDRQGFLNEVLQAVAESNTTITAVSGRSDKNKVAGIHMTILIQNIDHLHSVVERIKRVREVYTVRRIIQ